MGGKLSIAFSALAIMMGAALKSGAAPVVSLPLAKMSAATLAATLIDTTVDTTADTASEAGVPNEVGSQGSSPGAVRFRVDKTSGLLVETWINGAGPYVFAIDTGAGVHLLSERVARGARLAINTVTPAQLGGLTGVKDSTNRAVIIDRLAIGHSGNRVPSRQSALIVTLPASLDGILDPTAAYAPNGYTIDFPNAVMASFDGSLQGRPAPVGGAIVPWARREGGRVPFVRLQDGRVALVDTGSGFGLAVSGRDAVIVGRNHSRSAAVVSRDLGGGSISSRRVAPTTVSIGELELRGVPTDVLYGLEANAPVLLGRAALRPFRITFDPRRRLIEFEPPT